MAGSPPGDGALIAAITAEIARHGHNAADVPLAFSLEANPSSGEMEWAAYLDVRLPGGHAYDLHTTGPSLNATLSTALHRLKRELRPRRRTLATVRQVSREG